MSVKRYCLAIQSNSFPMETIILYSCNIVYGIAYDIIAHINK